MSMHEARVPLDIDRPRFDREVSPVATCPIAAEMAKVPPLVDESAFLNVCQETFHNQRNYTEADRQRVGRVLIFPTEGVPDEPIGSACPSAQ